MPAAIKTAPWNVNKTQVGAITHGPVFTSHVKLWSIDSADWALGAAKLCIVLLRNYQPTPPTGLLTWKAHGHKRVNRMCQANLECILTSPLEGFMVKKKKFIACQISSLSYVKGDAKGFVVYIFLKFFLFSEKRWNRKTLPHMPWSWTAEFTNTRTLFHPFVVDAGSALYLSECMPFPPWEPSDSWGFLFCMFAAYVASNVLY